MGMSINDDVNLREVALAISKLNRHVIIKIRFQKPSRQILQLSPERGRLGLLIHSRFISEFDPDGVFGRCVRDASGAITAGDFLLGVNGKTEWDEMRLELANCDTMTIGHYKTPPG